MMESSEQRAYDGPLDPDDSSTRTERTGLQIVARYEDYTREIPLNQGEEEHGSEQVVGYLDEENATLVLQSQGIELDGKRLILAQGSGGDEIIVFVSSDQDPSVEHSFEESVPGNSDNHTLAIECGSNNLEAISCGETQGIQVIETTDGLQNINKNGTVYAEQARELAYVDSDNNHYSSEALGNAVYHVQEKDDTTEMVFIPTTSQIISTGNNTRLLHLADVAHSEWATSELHVKEVIECARKISEGSVIVSQIRADSDSIKVGDAAITVVNEHDNTNSLHDEPMAAEFETSSPAVEESSSLLSVPPRDIDNAVSVIHVTSSTLVHDQEWRTKNIQEDDNQTEDTGQLGATLPAVSTNVTNLECSDVKETPHSELFSQSPVIEESSNHSQLKEGTDSSNKDDNVNYKTSATVEEPMDEDTNESSHLPAQVPSVENIDEDKSKQKDTISCNDNDSNTSMDRSQYLNNKISDPSSNNCENEMDFTNSEEALSEIHTCSERTFLSLRDNSESKSSFFSDNSQSKDHNLYKLKKLKSDSPSKEKKAIDEYEFENSSSNLDQELSHNSSLDGQRSNTVNSDDISTEVDVTKVSQSSNSGAEVSTGNLTFQGALTPVADNTKLDENQADNKNSETYYDNSQDLFDQGTQEEENSSSTLLKNANLKYFKNKQNSVSSEINHTDQNKSPEEKIIAVEKDEDIDNKSKENDSVDSIIITSEETMVKPPQRTYIRKRKISDSDRNIELFSLDDSSDPKDESSSDLTSKIFSPDNQKDQIMNDDNNLTDEDGYINLMPSDMNSRIKAISTSPMDERRTRSLRPRSSDQLEKNPDLIVDAEDSVSACWGAYLMEASFKPTNTEKTEEDVPKASSPDVPRVNSPKSPLKKRIRTPSHKKISAKGDCSKSGQQWDKLIKSTPIKMKDASSDKRKIREKVKKQVEKTLRNSENLNNSPILIPQHKKGRSSKGGKKAKTILHSSFPPTPKKVKTCGIRFLNDNSTEKNNSSAIDVLSTPSTSTQDLKRFQYACSNCSNFVSNKVNNLIIHLKYCTVKPSTDMIDYRVNDMERRQRIRGDFTESCSTVGKSSTSQNFSNGSVIDDDDGEPEGVCPSQELISQENGEEYEKEDDEDNPEEELTQNYITKKKKFGYRENEIVWATVNNRFWPALVHKIGDKKLELYLIDYPTRSDIKSSNVHMDISVDSIPNLLHTFDDAKWHKKMLAEANRLPYSDLFYKAVQKVDSYIRKRVIYNKELDGFSFFNISKNVDVAELIKEEVNDMIEENLEIKEEDDDQCVDLKELMECIFERHCDKHVIDIYNGVVTSERHNLHRHKNKETANKLKTMSWFGPFKSNSQMQIMLHDYFIELFKSKFGTRTDIISYIYEVWIPEGIIKAISIVKHISLLEAQIIFYKQDMTALDIEDFELDCEDL